MTIRNLKQLANTFNSLVSATRVPRVFMDSEDLEDYMESQKKQYGVRQASFKGVNIEVDVEHFSPPKGTVYFLAGNKRMDCPIEFVTDQRSPIEKLIEEK